MISAKIVLIVAIILSGLSSLHQFFLGLADLMILNGQSGHSAVLLNNSKFVTAIHHNLIWHSLGGGWHLLITCLLIFVLIRLEMVSPSGLKFL